MLVSGASGGGALAIQFATARGASVIATACRGPESDLGVTHIVDYTSDLAGQVRAIAPNGVDASLHLAGDGTLLVDLLASGGRLASTLGFGPDAIGRADVTATPVTANPDQATLDRLAADAAAGRVGLVKPLQAS